jgi:hypothetical protein
VCVDFVEIVWENFPTFSGTSWAMLLETRLLKGSEFFTGTDRQTDTADKWVMHRHFASLVVAKDIFGKLFLLGTQYW